MKRKKETNCPAMGLPRRASIQLMLLLFLASALLALSLGAGASPDDTDSVTAMVLPIGARQSVVASVASRRRSMFALTEGAANFSLPLEGAIKDYGCVRVIIRRRERERSEGKGTRFLSFRSPMAQSLSLSLSRLNLLSTSSLHLTKTKKNLPHNKQLLHHLAPPRHPSQTFFRHRRHGIDVDLRRLRRLHLLGSLRAQTFFRFGL